jgi:hypothetical protein
MYKKILLKNPFNTIKHFFGSYNNNKWNLININKLFIFMKILNIIFVYFISYIILYTDLLKIKILFIFIYK